MVAEEKALEIINNAPSGSRLADEAITLLSTFLETAYEIISSNTTRKTRLKYVEQARSVLAHKLATLVHEEAHPL